jgi:hypothetical protein
MEVQHPFSLVTLESPHSSDSYPVIEKRTSMTLDDATCRTVMTDMESDGSHTISSSEENYCVLEMEREHVELPVHVEDDVTTKIIQVANTPESATTTTRRRHCSIMKSSTEPLHIKGSSRAWKCLPKPNMEVLRPSPAPVEDDEEKVSSTKPRSVKFKDVQIRNYSQTVGDNPSISYGPPIQLDWDYVEHDPMCIDVYEDNRAPRRTLRQMILSYYHRRNVLTWQYGISLEDLRQAKRNAKHSQYERAVTRHFLPVMIVEDVVESAGRKAKRIFGKKTSSS